MGLIVPGLMRKLSRFMYGRNGVDALGRFTLFLYAFLAILNIVTARIAALRIFNYVIWGIETLALVLFFFRCFSRNYMRRRKENDLYMKLRNPIAAWFGLCGSRLRDRKTHVYRKCPQCRAVLRLPKTSGQHTVRCPKCGNRFEVRVR